MYIAPNKISPDSTESANGVVVNKYLVSEHNINNLTIPAMRSGKLKWVAIHNTSDLDNVSDDGRNYVAASINGAMNGVFATYYVDELCAWQLLEIDRQNWCSSDLTNPDGANAKGISIEIIMNGTTGENNIKARDNGARLAAWVLYKNGLDVDSLVTHTWAINTVKGAKGDKDFLCIYKGLGAKVCPYYIIPAWAEFVALVKKYIDKLNTPVYRVRKDWNDIGSQIGGTYASLDAAKDVADYNSGYKVYDSNNKMVYKPEYYLEKCKTIKGFVPIKFEPKHKAKTVTRFPKNKQITVYLGTGIPAENGTIWVRFTSAECKAFPQKYAWIPLKYIEQA